MKNNFYEETFSFEMIYRKSKKTYFFFNTAKTYHYFLFFYFKFEYLYKKIPYRKWLLFTLIILKPFLFIHIFISRKTNIHLKYFQYIFTSHISIKFEESF